MHLISGEEKGCYENSVCPKRRLGSPGIGTCWSNWFGRLRRLHENQVALVIQHVLRPTVCVALCWTPLGTQQ